MEETLVSFETAVLAKEKGFNEPCRCYFNQHGRYIDFLGDGRNDIMGYDKRCTAPTQSLLQKWIWDKYELWINIDQIYKEESEDPILFVGIIKNNTIQLDSASDEDPFKCLEKLLKKALHLLQ